MSSASLHASDVFTIIDTIGSLRHRSDISHAVRLANSSTLLAPRSQWTPFVWASLCTSAAADENDGSTTHTSVLPSSIDTSMLTRDIGSQSRMR
tara:strand:- start:480 stop:761 length:282 start_codon:yes stop_codon:yes gene_type:complete